MARRFEEADLNSTVFQAVRKDTPAAVSTNNHYHPLLVDGDGKLYVNIGDTIPVSSEQTYLGEQALSGNGASQNATLPAGTKTIWITARGGVAYGSVNAAAAAASSGTYVPEDGVRIIGPFSNITSLGVFAASGVTVHLLYEG
jgi:glucose/arabinose dehydrogenase